MENTANIESKTSYVFTFGLSPSYRVRESRHDTIDEARQAAANKRDMGYSTSRIKKEEA